MYSHTSILSRQDKNELYRDKSYRQSIQWLFIYHHLLVLRWCYVFVGWYYVASVSLLESRSSECLLEVNSSDLCWCSHMLWKFRSSYSSLIRIILWFRGARVSAPLFNGCRTLDSRPQGTRRQRCDLIIFHILHFCLLSGIEYCLYPKTI